MKKIKLSDLPQDMTLRELAQVAHAFGYELDLKVDSPDLAVGAEPLPKPSVPCQGMTRQGRRCSNKPRRGKAFCHAHATLEEGDEP